MATNDFANFYNSAFLSPQKHIFYSGILADKFIITVNPTADITL